MSLFSRAVTLFFVLLFLTSCMGPGNIQPYEAAAASISAEISGPGMAFSSLKPLPVNEGLEDYGYQTNEYFVSGVANGSPYKTRLVIRRPVDSSKFSGLVLAETMHPSGNAWLFHFTHRYSMSSGHIGVEIVTNSLDQIVEQNPQRYGDLRIKDSQENQIIAQVGALLRSESLGNPLRGLGVRKMILAGTSASANVLIDYLPTHRISRLAGGAPIYDGFLPTSNDREIGKVDVPVIQLATMTEFADGVAVMRQDSDIPGDEFRIYETAGIAHLDARDVDDFQPNPCAKPLSMHPIGTGFSVALYHLFQWVDLGVRPPRAQRMVIDGNIDNDGSLMAMDQYGNVQGGLPSPYVNVPVAQYAVRNEAAPGQDGFPGVLCRLAGYQLDFSGQKLTQIYGNAERYRGLVSQEVESLIEQGWLLPVDKTVVLSDAGKVKF